MVAICDGKTIITVNPGRLNFYAYCINPYFFMSLTASVQPSGIVSLLTHNAKRNLFITDVPDAHLLYTYMQSASTAFNEEYDDQQNNDILCK